MVDQPRAAPEQPIPPPHGWTLLEAAAALFPAEWKAASLPSDDAAARIHLGMPTPEEMLAKLPPAQITVVTVAAFFRDKGRGQAAPVDAALEPWVKAYQQAEAQIASAINAARAAAEDQRRELPALLAKRMQAGDLIGEGVNMAAGHYTGATVIQPELWGVAKIHLGFETPTTHRDGPRSYTSPPPEAGSVSGLPGPMTLHAVRIRLARPLANAPPAEPPHAPSIERAEAPPASAPRPKRKPPSDDEAKAYMTEIAEAFFAEKGKPQKQEDVVRKCQEKFDIAERRASRLHKSLPEHLRNLARR